MLQSKMLKPNLAPVCSTKHMFVSYCNEGSLSTQMDHHGQLYNSNRRISLFYHSSVALL